MAALGTPRRAAVQGNSIMIFVTVGAQMPFDRLIRTIDEWAHSTGRKDVFAQIGQTSYRPSNIQWTQFLKPEEFLRHYESAKVVIAHAGTGSIITALQLGKPILVMPRQASLHETRNDHQVATCKQFCRFDSVIVATNEKELLAKLEKIDEMGGRQALGSHASQELIKAIREFIDTSLMK